MKPKIAITIVALSVIAFACQEEFIPAEVQGPHPLVVEGYIEASEDLSSPPYVFLTRSFPFFNELSGDELDDFFVHDADVRVSDGEREVVLQECTPSFFHGSRVSCLFSICHHPTRIQVRLQVFLRIQVSKTTHR